MRSSRLALGVALAAVAVGVPEPYAQRAVANGISTGKQRAPAGHMSDHSNDHHATGHRESAR